MNRNGDAPFLVQFHPYAVHGPIGNSQARSDLLNKYQSLPAGSQDNNESFGALIEGMDQSVARLVDYLENTPDPTNGGQPLANNTLVLFLSDNGGRQPQSNNGPLKGQKGELDEGGIRTPLIAWSGNPALVDGGTVNDTPVMGVDLFRTFASLAGATEPADTPLDGEDLSGIIADSTAELGREDLFWHFPGYLVDGARNQRPQSVIRSGDWKLFYNYEDQSYELYNLATDIAEANNLASTETEIAGELAAKLMVWLQSTNAPLATLRSGTLNLDIDGSYYADGAIQTLSGSLQISAGQEVPFVLGDFLVFADLNGDGVVDVSDWTDFRSNMGGVFTGLTEAESFALGDLDGDFDNDIADFILFKASFELAFGAEAFAQLLAVPEPSAAILVAAAFPALPGTRRRPGRRMPPLAQ